jgi:hypothetical protein
MIAKINRERTTPHDMKPWGAARMPKPTNALTMFTKVRKGDVFGLPSELASESWPRISYFYILSRY